MPYCSNCGTENAGGVRFCSNCGANMSASSSPPPPPPPSGAGQYSGGGGYGQYGGGPAQGVPNYMVQSILATIFCCMPLGIAAIVFASQANSKAAAGDYAAAMVSANKAKTFTIISVVAGLVVAAIYFLIAINSTSTSGNDF